MIDRRRLHGAAGGAIAAASVLAASSLLGCFEQPNGDRREGCPAGETCSPLAPDGLAFVGAALADDLFSNLEGPRYTARGGTQRFGVYLNHSLVPPSSYPMRSSDPAVLTVSGAPAIEGLAEGGAYVRVLDGDGLLMDRFFARVVRVDHAALSYDTPERRTVFLAGHVRFGLALFDAEGHRVVDEGMGVIARGVELHATEAWDEFELELPAEGASLRVSAGGELFDVELPATLSFDDIGLRASIFGRPLVEEREPLRVGSSACFELLSGGRAVANASEPFSFTIDGVPVSRPSDASDGCVSIPEGAGPTVTIGVSAGGLERTFVAATGPAPSP